MTIFINNQLFNYDVYPDGSIRKAESWDHLLDETKDQVIDLFAFNSDDIMTGYLVCSYLGDYFFESKIKSRIKLNIQHLPNLRHDRVMDNMGANSEYTFNIFKSLGRDSLNLDLSLICPHDIQLMSYRDNYRIIREKTISKAYDQYMIIFPDKTPQKRVLIDWYKTILDDISKNNIADKKRIDNKIVVDVSSHLDVKDKSIFIPDDLADGGWSTALLAKKSKDLGAKYVEVYVHHGLFGNEKSKATLENMRNHGVDKVSCYYSRYNIETGIKIDNLETEIHRQNNCLIKG